MKYCYRPTRVAKVTNSESIKCWRGRGENRVLTHWWWEWKMVQPPWKVVWQLPKKWNIYLTHKAAIPRLCTDPRKLKFILTEGWHIIIYNSPQGQTTPSSVHWKWTKKRDMHSRNGAYHSTATEFTSTPTTWSASATLHYVEGTTHGSVNYRISLTWKVQKRQIYRDRKQAGVAGTTRALLST